MLKLSAFVCKYESTFCCTSSTNTIVLARMVLVKHKDDKEEEGLL